MKFYLLGSGFGLITAVFHKGGGGGCEAVSRRGRPAVHHGGRGADQRRRLRRGLLNY